MRWLLTGAATQLTNGDAKNDHTTFTLGGLSQLRYDRSLKLTKDTLEPHALECIEFARAIAEGRPSPVPPEQSLQVMSILDGIYRSQREGREVAIEA